MGGQGATPFAHQGLPPAPPLAPLASPPLPPPKSDTTYDELRDRIEARYRALSYGLDPMVDVSQLARQVADGLYEGVSEREVDELAAETAAYQASMHPDFAKLAARVAVQRLHAQTEDSVVETFRALRAYRDPVSGSEAPLVSAELLELAEELAPRIEPAMRHDRDFELDYFGLRTLLRSYLLGEEGGARERPQHMLMRVALCVHGRDAEAVLRSYELMSRGVFTHATPTMFNAGSARRQQLSSCFLLTTRDDSIDGIFETLEQCALISRSAGGIGLSVSHVRASQSYIRSTGGKSAGLVPMLRVFDATARFVDQGGGKRKGAFAIYLEPWHADTLDFLQLKKNHGKEEARARDLFYALWVPDLFMRRVQEGGKWSFFCPNEAPGLIDVHGAAFDELYERYEREGRARSTVDAQSVWFAILESQMETGTPYMMYKDACNAKSNQRHLGTIRSSNLCTEIVEYTSKEEAAVCNLASIALPRFVVRRGATAVAEGEAPGGEAGGEAGAAGGGAGGEEGGELFFDLNALRRVARFVARSLDRVIDRTHYPLPEAETSNLRHRPVGIGVQGLADAFAMLQLPFESEGAAQLNRDIFEALYFGALEESCALAEELGPHPSHVGSPASNGELQFDAWGVTPSSRWDWAGLKAKIATHGLRNSLLVAPMPTASTAQILGNNECFEPYTSNLYVRRTLAGEFFVLNPHLQRELQRLGVWGRELRDEIIAAGGSVQGLAQLPAHVREVYKTAWEMKQRVLIDMAADRGAFIDQSQSLNLFLKEPTFAQLSSMHFHSWRRGLKTGMYYLRTQPAADAIKFTLGAKQQQEGQQQQAEEDNPARMECSLRGSDCESCGS